MKPNTCIVSFCVGLRKTLNPTYKSESALSLPSPKKMGEEKKGIKNIQSLFGGEWLLKNYIC
jgi:hypothetical protein